MNIRRWKILSLDKGRAALTAQSLDIPFFLAMLLNIRKMDDENTLQELLEDNISFCDPFLLYDMDKAAARINKAVENMERIAVYGDYDADGITATAMVYSYLETRGADVLYYIPQREGEGYGMNLSAVEYLAQQGVQLIITVDNGISSVEEVARARALNVDVVITDHHRPQAVLPEAVAVVDAYRPEDKSAFKHFAGVGIAFKLLMALEGEASETADLLEAYGDLAAIGTIGDVVPLTGENRALVRAGLEILSQSERPGIRALLTDSGLSEKQLTATNVAFTLVPRINATGRMGAPDRAVRLLTSMDEQEAATLAEEICADNEERRRVEASISEAAFADMERRSLFDDRVIVVDGEDWHHGVIGIVASRITERYGKPCIVISRGATEAKGSGRSIEGFSLFDAISACGAMLMKFGGHPMAAGITLRSDQIEAFRTAINRYAAEKFPQMPVQTITLDCKLNPAALSVSMVESLHSLEPFGNENPQPIFGLYGMELCEITPVGNGNHLRLTLEKNGSVLTAMRFGTRAEDFGYMRGDKVDLAVQLEAREYRGQTSLSVLIRDLKPSALDIDRNIRSLSCFESWERGETLTDAEKRALMPDRSALALCYRQLRALSGAIHMLNLTAKLGESYTVGKLLVALRVFEERGLVHSTVNGELLTATLLETSGKTDIEKSPVLDTLR